MRLVANWRRVCLCSATFWINIVTGLAASAAAAVEYAADGKYGAAALVAGVNFFAAFMRIVKQIAVSGPDEDE